MYKFVPTLSDFRRYFSFIDKKKSCIIFTNSFLYVAELRG